MGLLIEPTATNLFSGDMATALVKDTVTLEQIDQSIGVGFPAYRMQRDGVNGTHALAISLAQTSATQTIYCYFKSCTNILVQLAT